MRQRRLAQRIPLPIRQAIVRATPAQLWERLSPVAHGEAAWQVTAGRRLAAVAVRRDARKAGADYVALRTAGRSFLARTVDAFTAENALDGNLDVVARSLAAAEIEYAVVAADIGRRRVVMVDSRDRDAVLSALTKPPVGRVTYIGSVRDGRLTRVRSTRAPSATAALCDEDVLRVFEVIAASSGTLMAGPNYGCEIEFWTADEDGTLHAPRPNRRAISLPVNERDGHELVLTTGGYRSYAPLVRPHAFDVTFPIDIVYTWVDGSDPAWRARKRQAWSEVEPGSVNALSANESRYMSRDELRYSLRSVEMYAAWVRNIYIVTDEQVPPWLNVDHPKLHVIDHREIFDDSGELPTFNSHAIESRLHHIEGLADHYLYLNDDVFFGRPISPETFFLGNGLSKFFLSKAHIDLGEASALDLPVMSAGKNNRALLSRNFGRSITNKFKHVPHPQLRDVLHEMELVYGEDFKRTGSSQFRHPDDVSVASALFHYYAWFTRRAVPGDIAYFYADIGAPETDSRLRRLLRERDFDCFCLNDHDSGKSPMMRQSGLVERFLAAYFPAMSSYELSELPHAR